MAPYFSRKLVKAVNDWQAGSVGKREKFKAIRSALADQPLNRWFTECDEVCYRRTKLTPAAVKKLFLQFVIPEETSAWTTRVQIAAKFKDGPPPPPEPGVIFEHRPSSEEVVLNLERLYEHDQFWPSVEYWEGHHLNLTKGIRRYSSGQHEVILTLDKVPHSEIFAFGSNSADTILEGIIDGVEVVGETNLNVQEITDTFSEHHLPTERWLYGESVRNVYRNWVIRVLNRPDIKLDP